MTPSNSIFDLLKFNKLKRTAHRVEILSILDQSVQPIPADDIYAMLKKNNHTISFSTIYRTLDTLVGNSLITRIVIENDSRSLYEINRQAHHHFLICLGCTKILTLEECPLPDEFESKIELASQFKIVGHKLELYGYCKECQNKL